MRHFFAFVELSLGGKEPERYQKDVRRLRVHRARLHRNPGSDVEESAGDEREPSHVLLPGNGQPRRCCSRPVPAQQVWKPTYLRCLPVIIVVGY